MAHPLSDTPPDGLLRATVGEVLRYRYDGSAATSYCMRLDIEPGQYVSLADGAGDREALASHVYWNDWGDGALPDWPTVVRSEAVRLGFDLGDSALPEITDATSYAAVDPIARGHC